MRRPDGTWYDLADELRETYGLSHEEASQIVDDPELKHLAHSFLAASSSSEHSLSEAKQAVTRLRDLLHDRSGG